MPDVEAQPNAQPGFVGPVAALVQCSVERRLLREYIEESFPHDRNSLPYILSLLNACTDEVEAADPPAEACEASRLRFSKAMDMLPDAYQDVVSTIEEPTSSNRCVKADIALKKLVEVQTELVDARQKCSTSKRIYLRP